MNHRQEIIDIVMRIENLDYLEFIYNMLDAFKRKVGDMIWTSSKEGNMQRV